MITKQEIQQQITELENDMRALERESKQSRGVLQDAVAILLPYQIRHLEILETLLKAGFPNDAASQPRV